MAIDNIASSLVNSEFILRELVIKAAGKHPNVATVYKLAKEASEFMLASCVLYTKIKEAIQAKRLAASSNIEEKNLEDRVVVVNTIAKSAFNVFKELMDILPALSVFANAIPGIFSTVFDWLKQYIDKNIDSATNIIEGEQNQIESNPQSQENSDQSEDILAKQKENSDL